MHETVYVAMEQDVLVARRDGDRWRTDRVLAGRRPECVAVDPGRSERVYCGTFDSGLWRSDDAGSTWAPVGPGIPHARVMSVAVSRVDRGGEHGVVWAGTEPSAVFRSTDGGDTWQERPALRSLPSAPTWSYPPRPDTNHVRWLVPDPADAGTIFASIELGGVMRSFDGGATWDDRHDDTPRDAHTVVAHPLAPGRLYSAAGDGFMAHGHGYAESRDGGATWRPMPDGLRHHYLWSVAVDAGDPDAVVLSGAASPPAAHHRASAESHVYRRRGGTWEPVTDGLPDATGTIVPELAAHPTSSGVFYLASNRGLYRSEDAGRSWRRVALDWPAEYQSQHVKGLAVAAD